MSRGSLSDPRSPRVRRLKALHRRAVRAAERRFLAEGAHAVEEALAAAGTSAPDVRVREVVCTRTAAERHGHLIELANAHDIPVHNASDHVMDALTETVTPQGIVAVVDFLDVSIDTLLTSEPRLLAVLANVRDPGNAGSVIRAADAAGCDGVVFAGDSVDPYNGKTVRASVGGHFHLPLVVSDDIGSVVEELRDGGLHILAADGTGPTDLAVAENEGLLAQRTAWLFGNEAWGMPDDTKLLADQLVRIPMYGRAESLNLAMSAALCLYASARAQGRSPRGA